MGQAPVAGGTSGGPCQPAKADAGSQRALIGQIARCEARRQQIPEHIVLAVIEIESNFHTGARGADGEVGLMQIMPPTAQMLGFQGTLFQLEDMYTNIRLGTRYLAEAYRQASGDLCTTVMKYRAGHGETRFSYRSVEYCRRARAILRREDIEVTGELPTPTFGLPAMAGAGRSGNSGGGSGSGACIARQLRPGPGYMRCLRHAKGKTARSIASARRSLFQ